jgi:hypothetical protein
MSRLIEIINRRFAGNHHDGIEKDDIKNEMYILHERLKKHEQEFNMTDDNDIIEALIYEEKALQSRFAFLVKQARELGIEINYVDREG